MSLEGLQPMSVQIKGPPSTEREVLKTYPFISDLDVLLKWLGEHDANDHTVSNLFVQLLENPGDIEFLVQKLNISGYNLLSLVKGFYVEEGGKVRLIELLTRACANTTSPEEKRKILNEMITYLE